MLRTSFVFLLAMLLMPTCPLAAQQPEPWQPPPEDVWQAPPPDTRQPPPPQTQQPPPGEQVMPTLEPLPPVPIICPDCPPPKIWEGCVELGLNASEGNSETFNFRFGARAKRCRPADVLSLDLTYAKNSANDIETANKALFDGRQEWLFADSPWTVYIHGTAEYDEFKAFDVRLSLDSGLGYRFIQSEATSLIGRFGPGVSHEIGGPDDDFVPEAVLGMEFEHRLSERQKLCASAEYLPALTDIDDYRFNSKMAWELLVDPVWNVSLQLAATDRYDSTPQGAMHNDLDYSLLFLWAF